MSDNGYDRFATRLEGDGTWSVIDLWDGSVAHFDGHHFVSLSLDVAQAAARELNARYGQQPHSQH